METIKSKASIIRLALIILPVIILLLFLATFIYVKSFNRQVHAFNTEDENFPVSMTFGGEPDSTSEWKKRDFNLNGQKVDLNGQIINGALINNTGYEINDWNFRIDFKDDCFINNAWCGTVEIHQRVLTDEKVQTLDLRNYDLKDISLDYRVDKGDLLINLYKGDYIIYHPSEEVELPIAKNSQMTMAFIVYYLDFPDISEREVSYSFHRRIWNGYSGYVLGIFFLIWLFLTIIYAVYYMTYHAAVREMEIKKSGIASMSDMYAIIYIIDIKSNELMPVVADEESEKLRPKHLTASEQLRNMFKFDCEEAYQDIAYEFCDLSTLEERLKNRKTVVFEYKSKYYGWCRIRFFAIDKEKKHPLEKVVFTIQVINEEKKEIETIAQRVDIAESESKAKSTFLENISHEIRTPINTVIDYDARIFRESEDPAIKVYAGKIKTAANGLLSIIDGILDISKLEAGSMELASEEYSVSQMSSEIISMIEGSVELGNLQFICDISEDIPAQLYGDSVRLKQVIISLIRNAVKYTEQGSVKLTIYGKEHEGMEHLLISVKDTGIGISEEEQQRLSERFSHHYNKQNHTIEGSGLGLNLVTGILELMESELHVISTYGEGSEFYFELEQKIVSEGEI